MAHCMRQPVIALRLAGLAGASDSELEATYYPGLMMNVYCHADAAEQAKWFGDEISMKGDGFEMLDMSTARMISFILRRVRKSVPAVARDNGGCPGCSPCALVRCGYGPRIGVIRHSSICGRKTAPERAVARGHAAGPGGPGPARTGAPTCRRVVTSANLPFA